MANRNKVRVWLTPLPTWQKPTAILNLSHIWANLLTQISQQLTLIPLTPETKPTDITVTLPAADYEKLTHILSLWANDITAPHYPHMSLAVDKNTAVIGQPHFCHFGVANIFIRNYSGKWQETAELYIDPPQKNDTFGYTTAISGKTVVIGAPNAATATILQYQPLSDKWVQIKRLIHLPESGFGRAVTIHGSTILIGATNTDTGKGSVTIYQRRQNKFNQWHYTAQLTTPDNADWFGWSVALEGKTAVVAAPLTENPSQSAGTLYIYHLDHPTHPTAKITVPKSDNFVNFGWNISLKNNQILADTFPEDHPQTRILYSFTPDKHTPTQWHQTDQLTLSTTVAGYKLHFINPL